LHRNTAAKILKDLTDRKEAIESDKENLTPLSKYESLRESLEKEVLRIRGLYFEDEDFKTAMNDEGFFYLKDDAYVFLRSVDRILHDNHMSYEDILKAIKTTIHIKNMGLTLGGIIKIAKAKVNVKDLNDKMEGLKTESHTLNTLIDSDSKEFENLEKLIKDKKESLMISN
jgi:chaperonin cofactor prefoldin